MASKTTKDLPSGRRPKPETNGSASSAAKKASKEVAPKEPKVPPRLPAASTASQAASASARPGSARGAPGSARRPGTPTGKTAKKKLQPAPALPKGTTPRADKQPTGGGVAVPQPSERQAKVERSKVEYYSAELLARKPLEDKAREQLGARAGKKVPIEISYTRNEAHRPAGRPEDSVRSRHELVPPTTVVLMFNAHHASFELVAGDVSTLPEAETIELKSLTSGKSIGRIKIAPEKSTPLEERVEFPNEWFVGSEHGLTHDGLQVSECLEPPCHHPRTIVLSAADRSVRAARATCHAPRHSTVPDPCTSSTLWGLYTPKPTPGAASELVVLHQGVPCMPFLERDAIPLLAHWLSRLPHHQ